MTATDDPPTPPTRRGPSRRTIVIIALAAGLLVVGTAVGLLVASAIDTRAAHDEMLAARDESFAAWGAAEAASETASASASALTERVSQVDAILAVTGAGIDETAFSELAAARADAATVLDRAGTPGELREPPLFTNEAQNAEDYRGYAGAYREQAKVWTQNAETETERAAALDEASENLDSAVTEYAEATATAGSALLAERSDAGEEPSAALQAQLDALPTTSPAELAAELVSYRAAVDAVVAASDAARAPKATSGAGGSGVRVADASSLTAVVNKRRGLAAGYVPPGLVIPPGIPNNNNQPVRSELVEPLQRMQADMAAAGIQLRIGSAYRSYASQQSIYNGFVSREGVAGADTHSARPGNSEHQTGLAVDLDDGTGCNLNRCFATTTGGQWLAANAWKYGFILRYGDGWEPIVGYTFEPWHYRYVGETVSTDMHNRGVRTLEEYFGLPAAPDYG